MAMFDESKAYAGQEDVFYDDGRELELLRFVYGRPDLDQIRGNSARVLAAIDEYARTQKYLMNVGEDKGRIVVELISEARPKTMVELGGYVGYSCILFADAVRRAGGEQYFTLERDPVFGAIIMALVDLAGLADFVTVVIGSSDPSIRRLHSQNLLKHIDILFLDHYKPAYTADLKRCEELRLVTPGSVLAADNVIKPGNPPYLEYVRSTVSEKRKSAGGGEHEPALGARFPDATAKQYAGRQDAERLVSARGNPNLVYESRLVKSFEPTGIPSKMSTAESSRFAHAMQNASLLVLSLMFLPLDTFILFLSYAVRVLVAIPATSHRARRRAACDNTGCFKPQTVLVTGVGMTKGLALARLFYTAGHNVVGADFEPPYLPISCGHFSRSVKRFHRLSKPDGTPVGSARYCQRIVDIVKKEHVSLWDGQAKEMVERFTPCRAAQFDAATTKKLHEKHSFIQYTRSVGLSVPETHTVTSSADALKILDDAHATGKKFILKYIGVDDAARGDMTLLPLNTPASTKAHTSRLQISEKRPWILQQFIDGPEFCTHALVVRGQVKAFTACPSAELLMHYKALPQNSALHRSMLRFTQELAAASDLEHFTGHLSFDFLVDRDEAREAEQDPNNQGRVTLYPIECNPRAHTAVVLFSDTPEMAEAYLPLLDEHESAREQQPKKSLHGVCSVVEPVYPRNHAKYYWIGHDLVTLVVLPALSLFSRRGNSFVEVFGSFRAFLEHLLLWNDGTYEIWDPLPAWWLYHVYWPFQFALMLRTGRKWSRVNVSTTKIFSC
ncbi:hypothetical protein N658DRAFT_518967 [Parathielavia hyrcaniae]|uniref:catechol O-methyltransferase n=1 Tax=Parathielavia hyrcaniae TaxID=113614 RepID=A0AAN6SWW7_9PEZI|nr:hypothetical protein N658DRAFT_518967 [Parathielavia hyrcaniae]